MTESNRRRSAAPRSLALKSDRTLESGTRPRLEWLSLEVDGESLVVLERRVLWCSEVSRAGRFAEVSHLGLHLALADRRVLPVVDPLRRSWVRSIPGSRAWICVVEGEWRRFAILADSIAELQDTPKHAHANLHALERVATSVRPAGGLVFFPRVSLTSRKLPR